LGALGSLAFFVDVFFTGVADLVDEVIVFVFDILFSKKRSLTTNRI